MAMQLATFLGTPCICIAVFCSLSYDNNVTSLVNPPQAYMNRYATTDRLGCPATDEDIARIHNGGPSGHKHSSTEGYWSRVRALL